MSADDSTREMPANPELARFLKEELGVDAAPPAPAGWTVTSALWAWRPTGSDGKGTAWYFITIDGDTAVAIQNASRGMSVGWGMVKVTAHSGNSRWQTTVFR